LLAKENFIQCLGVLHPSRISLDVYFKKEEKNAIKRDL